MPFIVISKLVIPTVVSDSVRYNAVKSILTKYLYNEYC